MPPRRTPTAQIPPDSYESHFENAALFEFSRVINSSYDLNFVLSHVLLTIMGKILSTRGMALLSREKGNFRIDMVKGFPADIQGREVALKSVPRALFAVDRVSPSKHPWVKTFSDLGVSILFPLYSTDHPIGLLGFGKSLSNRKLRQREVTYLRSLANIAATAIEKSRIIEELQHVNRMLDRKIQELNTLFELGKEFGGLLDPERLVRLFVFSLLGQVGVSRYLICLRDGPDMKIVASRIDGASPQSELLAALTKVKGAVLAENVMLRGTVDPREALAGLGISVVVPMQLQGETKGLMLLGEKLSHEPFSQADLEFLSSLGNLAIISIENARLFKEAIEKQKLEDELMIAREIQKGLLPSVLPEIPRFEIAATNISSKQVGGDYYDVIPLDETRWIIAIGDVSGKGTPAALLMANLQATIRALVPLQLPLHELTGRVNDLMCQNTGGNKFVTFFWGIVDHRSMTLTYVNAGHNYPYLRHSDGRIERLDRGGMILGVLPAVTPYEESTLPLEAGELLVLFTDGVSEAMSREGKEYGEDRLQAVIESSVGKGAQAIIDAVHHDILGHTTGAPQSDDITMMVIKVS